MSKKKEKRQMNITPVELMEFGKVMMIWGGIMFAVGAVCFGIGYIYKDFFYEVAMGIMENWK